MTKARRPDVFNEESIIQHFVDQGQRLDAAKAIVSDMKLVIPMLIRELGAERIDEMLSQRAPELHLSENAFWPSLTRHMVRWAAEELNAYKARKEQ